LTSSERIHELARLAPVSALGLNWPLPMSVLGGLVVLTVDVVLALAAMLGRQSLAEFGFGLVLGCLFLAGFVTSAHEANSYR